MRNNELCYCYQEDLSYVVMKGVFNISEYSTVCPLGGAFGLILTHSTRLPHSGCCQCQHNYCHHIHPSATSFEVSLSNLIFEQT